VRHFDEDNVSAFRLGARLLDHHLRDAFGELAFLLEGTSFEHRDMHIRHFCVLLEILANTARRIISRNAHRIV
jgi:hypothetical protein